VKIGVVFPQDETGTDPVAIRDYAQAVEAMGYDHILAHEHVLGANAESRPGWSSAYRHTDRFHEPFVLFGFLAGAEAELAGMLITRAYHLANGDAKKTDVLIPDSAHGTNPASAAMAGFNVVAIPSDSNGNTDMEALKASVSDRLAGFMLTQPSTLGLFDTNILEVTRTVHDAGGIVYGDGANLNALLGRAARSATPWSHHPRR